MSVHIPVLVKEVLKYLDPKSGQKFIDATLGGGGHTKEILKLIGETGQVLAIDADLEAVRNGKKLFSRNKNIVILNSNFENIKKVAIENSFLEVDGIIADLGLSSDQLENSDRGFTFQKDEPLDMRFDIKQEITAGDILNSYSQDDLRDIFQKYGETRNAGKLAEYIRKTRKQHHFSTTFDLVNAVNQISAKERSSKIHPATLFFQALRVYVNREMDVLPEFLGQSIQLLKPGGRMVIIAFQGAEDRIVKLFLKSESRKANPTIKILTKKPITPSFDEIKTNPRSRSAKLRVAEKI